MTHTSIQTKLIPTGYRSYCYSVSLEIDEPGILCKISSVLFAHNIDIKKARVFKDNGIFRDEFDVVIPADNYFDDEKLNKMQSDLIRLIDKKIEIIDYLSEFQDKASELILAQPLPRTGTSIEYTTNTHTPGILKIRTYDRPGLLFQITHALYILYIDIAYFSIDTDPVNREFAIDTFHIVRDNKNFIDQNDMSRVYDALQKVI